MTAFFSKLFHREQNKESAIGIDIGSSAIKIVELKIVEDRAILGTYASIALGPYAGETIGTATKLSESKLSEALSDAIRESKAVSRSAGVAIPFASSLVSVIKMPKVNERQLATMVPIEARKYIPVPMTEVELDWSVIPAPDSAQVLNTQDVVVVAIHKDALTKYDSILQASNVERDFFEIEIFSSLRSVAGSVHEPTIIIDCGAASTKLYVVERGVLRGSHTINRGAQDITATISRAKNITRDEAEILKRQEGLLPGGKIREDALLIVDHIASEARTMIQSAERKIGKKIERVVLLGGGAVLKGFAEQVAEVLHRTVEPGDPFDRVGTPVFLKDTLREVGPEFAVALGSALRAVGE